ncbi:hypothetical protein [Yoonia litorea]|uniref:Uncharacterized protein n=1 Tax=Yoonia litorea TaxID=1123755 RepID=A0A1I6MZS6_9RHOB|nr:hypothetical protein [Yoonia litorea]SFS21215.1 hypothetical protein SAMN05444714_2769 [Yoonia litorea]
MHNRKYKVKHPELSGSELHHDLKNEPGEDGDPNHIEEETLSDKDGDKDQDSKS